MQKRLNAKLRLVKQYFTVGRGKSWCKSENYIWAKISQNRQDLCGFPVDLDELPSDPRKNMSEGFCEARLLGKICGETFGWVKAGALGHIFGGDHEITCFSALCSVNSCIRSCAWLQASNFEVVGLQK